MGRFNEGGVVAPPPNPEQPTAEPTDVEQQPTPEQPAVVGADETTLAAESDEGPATIKLTIASNSPDTFVGFVDGEEYRIEKDKGLDVSEALVEPLMNSALANGVVLNARAVEPTGVTVDESQEG